MAGRQAGGQANRSGALPGGVGLAGAGMLALGTLVLLIAGRPAPPLRGQLPAATVARQVLPLPTRPPAPATPTPPTPPAAPAALDASLVFTVPVGLDAFHARGARGERWAGLASGGDGSFWIGDADNRLLHYSASGVRLGILDLAPAIPVIAGVKAWAADLWVLDGAGPTMTVIRLNVGGQVLARYPVPAALPTTRGSESLVDGDLTLVLGGAGEVLLAKGTGVPYVQIVDARGQAALQALSGYPAAGTLYGIDNPFPRNILAGARPVTVTLGAPATALEVLAARPDGSFYVVSEQAANGPPVYSPDRSILHYGADGRLIAQARVALPGYTSRDLAVAPDGSVYALRGHFEGSQGIPMLDRAEVHRIALYPPGTDVPAPTPIPVPIFDEPPPPTYPPGPTPIADLATLVGKAGIVARVKLAAGGGVSQTFAFDAQVEEWFKRPAALLTDRLGFEIYSGGSGDAPLLHTYRKYPADDYILFLNQTGTTPRDGSAQYALTDIVAGIFSIRDGKIAYPGIPIFKGWPAGQFAAAIRAVAPTPLPIDPQQYALALLGRDTPLVAEVAWTDRPARAVQVAGSPRLLQTVQVVRWLQNRAQREGDFLGLALAPALYARLAHGSGRYILFLAPAGSPDTCAEQILEGYLALTDETRGVFEVRDSRIGTAGIAGYSGNTVAQFAAALQGVVPTPGPRPPSAGRPATLPQAAGEAQLIAEVTLAGADQPGVNAPGWVMETFHVRSWLKKPAAYTAASIVVRLYPSETCRFALDSGAYILFLRLDKNAPPDAVPTGPYDLVGGPIFGIRDATVDYADMPRYWGWPLAQLEAAIRAAVAGK